MRKSTRNSAIIGGEFIFFILVGFQFMVYLCARVEKTDTKHETRAASHMSNINMILTQMV